MTDRVLFDPGLQPERTELAWRRTALAIAVGSLVALRALPLTLPSAGAWALVPGLAGLAVATGLWFAARHRQLRVSAALAGPVQGALPGGGMLLALTFLGLAFGGLSLAVVVLAMLP